MEKTATLNLRVNPTVKERAEAVLSKLGVPMSTAIDMYLNQISLTGGIPFAVTFGNHDCQVGISNQDQFYHIYKRLPNCIGEQAEGIDGGGTCAIPIEASDGSGRDVFELYLFDSGTDAREGGYEAFDPKIIAWYRKQREDLREKNGMYVPSIVFQHIPMREYYEVLKLVDRGEKGAVRAYRTHKNEYYKLGETCGAGDIFLEPPSVPDVNTGEIEPQDYF